MSSAGTYTTDCWSHEYEYIPVIYEVLSHLETLQYTAFKDIWHKL